ncbi:MAG: ArsC/Spx/MgsR family protein [Pseudomonadota bacterium]
MSTITVYALKTCDTCRKALKAIEASGTAFDVVDVRADGIPADAMQRITQAVGPDGLVNRRSTTWRGLEDGVRADAMDPAKTASVLSEHPTLMKRPVIVSGDAVHVGWTADVQKAVLG